jgi:hypothetical protein
VVAVRVRNAASVAVVGVCAVEVCGVLSDVDGVPDPEVPVVPEAGGVVVPAELLGGVLDVEAGGDDDCVCVPVPGELGGGVVPPLLGGVDEGGVEEGGGVVGGGVVGGGVVGGGVVDAGACTSWHCQIGGELVTVAPTLPADVIVAAMPAGANAALAAKPPAAVKSVPPAMRPIATGRTRAKHM